MSGKQSFEAFREAWQRHIVANKKLLGTAKLVGIAISWHFNRKEGGRAWPSINMLMKLTGFSNHTVIAATKSLEAHGYSRVIRSKSGRRNNANRYVPALPTAAHQLHHVVKQWLHQGSEAIATPEPLTEPLSEPPKPCTSYMASSSDDAMRTSKKEGRKASGCPRGRAEGSHCPSR
jgi:hypothetical protein